MPPPPQYIYVLFLFFNNINVTLNEIIFTKISNDVFDKWVVLLGFFLSSNANSRNVKYKPFSKYIIPEASTIYICHRKTLSKPEIKKGTWIIRLKCFVYLTSNTFVDDMKHAKHTDCNTPPSHVLCVCLLCWDLLDSLKWFMKRSEDQLLNMAWACRHNVCPQIFVAQIHHKLHPFLFLTTVFVVFSLIHISVFLKFGPVTIIIFH